MNTPALPLSRPKWLHPALWSSLGAAAILAACAGWMGPRTIDIPREDLQAKLSQKFPISKQVLGYLDVTASRPQLTMLPQSGRISAQVDLKIDDTMFRKLHEGWVQASFGLRYEPLDQTVRLDQVTLDEVSLPTLPSYFLDSLKRLGNQVARDNLQGYVIKQFKPDDLQKVDRMGYQVAGLRVTASGLAVDLVPKPDKTADASPSR
jgi:hypothetical protein